MKAIVVSPQRSVENESEIVTQLFKIGLESYHLRKPHYSTRKMRNYLEKIPKEYHNRIVIHSHHKLALKYNLMGIHLPSKNRSGFKNWLRLKLIRRKNPWLSVSTSYHAISELDNYSDAYDYVFLSPIFDSISKMDYQSGFKEFSLVSALQRTKYKVIALGGIDAGKIDTVKEMGFYGAAFLGSIWNSESPLDDFNAIFDQCKLIDR